MNEARESKLQRIVVVGDLSHRGRYHLGDEAMSEVALEQLTRRGYSVTFIAGDPAVCAAQYGVPAVGRFGFSAISDRADKVARLEQLVAGVRGACEVPEDARHTIAALRSADAILIAGGGNLNSIGEHHLFERLALTRIARQLEIPLYVTSQTVGPHLRKRDQDLVREIATSARVFGVRESRTAALMRGIAPEATIVRTVDDAVLMTPDSDIASASVRWGLPEDYVVGSFTFHERTTELDVEEYYRTIAEMLDGVVHDTGRDVVLLPHMGTLTAPDTVQADDDAHGHDRIAAYSASGRLRSLPIMTARELLAVTQGADFTISTRYHPLVFGAALGVPAVGIVHSYYSATRMRGALANAGMESFALPFEAWDTLLGSSVVAALCQRLPEFRAHISAVGESQRKYQSAWWDGIAADLAGTGTLLTEDFMLPTAISWADEHQTELLALARLAQEGTNLTRLNDLIDDKDRDQRVAKLERQLAVAMTETTLLRKEIVELRHRVRPPGAAMRDRIRLAFRRNS
ncbi:polysaccharide pyruvyl transferase family protein [Leucobacter luti]|uniref:polysaccharide pyruvyl transferase family protein n=1 Tax=Leucobacter luti TaxID=340320 RepID=UPI001404A2AB|nr:polysaccharide pyruvyl transferase family protein [Leucobacter luti]MCW2289851.1 polysaccharide pyruvyl transferase WcaK-like protein [Leucobacter luti]